MLRRMLTLRTLSTTTTGLYVDACTGLRLRHDQLDEHFSEEVLARAVRLEKVERGTYQVVLTDTSQTFTLFSRRRTAR